MRSTRLAALELRRFGRGRLPRAAMAAMLLPLLYGALYLWSFWDPYKKLGKVPVAVVNAAQGAQADGEKGERVAAGDSGVEGLHGSDTFDWHETDAADARRGVEDGRYYRSLTLPRDADNYIVGQISRTVLSEVRAAVSSKASRGFLNRIFKGRQRPSDSAGRLHQGSGTLAKGSKRVADGIRKLSGKVDRAAGTARPFLRDHKGENAATARDVSRVSKRLDATRVPPPTLLPLPVRTAIRAATWPAPAAS